MDDSGSIKLLLVSRHALTRTALARLIEQRPGFLVVGDVGTRREALVQAAEHAPDVILLDPQRDSDLWMDAIGPLATAAGRRARVLLLTELNSGELHRQALIHGARGILDLDHPPETLFRAIERVHAGELWLERRLMAELLSNANGGPGTAAARIDALTPREHEVVQLVAQGLRNKVIAARLSVSDVTVRHHLTAAFAKLDVSDRLSLVVFAFQHGLAEPNGPQHK